MKERRLDVRRLVNMPVRLYHPCHGRIDGTARNISDGGMALELNSFKELSVSSDMPLLLRPVNLDVLFTVVHLRQKDTALVVRFLEENQ